MFGKAHRAFFAFLLVGLGILAAGSSARASGTPIRIAYPSGMNGQITVTMQQAKIAEKFGFAPQYTFFQYGPPMMEALASGAVDAVITSLMPITSYIAKLPGQAKIIAMLGNSSYSLMVGKASPVTTAADLKGRTIGVSFGSDSHLDTLIYLKTHELDGATKLVNIEPAGLATALDNRSVDAIVIRQPQVLRLEQASDDRVVQTWPFRFLSIMRTRYMKDHPDAAKRYIAALRESMFYIAQHKTQASIWFGKQLRVDPKIIRAVSADDPNYNVKSIRDIEVAVTPASRQMISRWFAAAHAFGMIHDKIDPAVAFGE